MYYVIIYFIISSCAIEFVKSVGGSEVRAPYSANIAAIVSVGSFSLVW